MTTLSVDWVPVTVLLTAMDCRSVCELDREADWFMVLFTLSTSGVSSFWYMAETILEDSNQSVFHYLKCQKQKKVECANSIDPDEVAFNEPPHLDLLCLPSSL